MTALAFDMSKYVVEPLTCSIEDENWIMELPPVINAEIQNVEVSWVSTNSNIFSFDKDNLAVVLNPDKKQNIMRGIICPKRNVEILKFKLKSDIYGEETS